MPGSTFLHVADPVQLRALVDNLDALEGMDVVELESMLTLDFVHLCEPAGLQWSVGDPVHFDEVNGLAIFRVSPDSLELAVRDDPEMPPDHREDLNQLRSFVRMHGASQIYELTTF